MIEVLWIDDEFSDPGMEQFAIEAENQGIILNGFKSFEEGFEALEANIEKFDVILLDGLFFEKRGQVRGTEDVDGLGSAIAKINELKSRKPFPWFVLSGKDQFTKGENPLLTANKVELYDKTNPKDTTKLFEDIKQAASKTVDFKLKYKYSNLFRLCEANYIGENELKRLMLFVKHIENIKPIDSPEDQLNSLRKVIEIMFDRLAASYLLPPEILSNRGGLNGSSLFLSNRHNGFEHTEDFIEPLIGECFHRLLNITQDASHSKGDLKFKVDAYLKNNSSGYLLNSCIFLLFELMDWFGKMVDNYPNPAKNKKLWVTAEAPNFSWIKGIVANIADNGWGTFQSEDFKMNISIPNHMVEKNGLDEKMNIEIKTKPSPDGTKTFIDQIRISS